MGVAVGVWVFVGVEVGVAVGGRGVFVLVAVKVRLFVGVGLKVGVGGSGMIWMASTLALSTPAGPNVIVMSPPEGAILWNTSSTALLAPPAEARMSKLVRTAFPLMETLKTRWPAAVQ